MSMDRLTPAFMPSLKRQRSRRNSFVHGIRSQFDLNLRIHDKRGGDEKITAPRGWKRMQARFRRRSRKQAKPNGIGVPTSDRTDTRVPKEHTQVPLPDLPHTTLVEILSFCDYSTLLAVRGVSRVFRVEDVPKELHRRVLNQWTSTAPRHLRPKVQMKQQQMRHHCSRGEEEDRVCEHGNNNYTEGECDYSGQQVQRRRQQQHMQTEFIPENTPTVRQQPASGTAGDPHRGLPNNDNNNNNNIKNEYDDDDKTHRLRRPRLCREARPKVRYSYQKKVVNLDHRKVWIFLRDNPSDTARNNLHPPQNNCDRQRPKQQKHWSMQVVVSEVLKLIRDIEFYNGAVFGYDEAKAEALLLRNGFIDERDFHRPRAITSNPSPVYGKWRAEASLRTLSTAEACRVILSGRGKGMSLRHHGSRTTLKPGALRYHHGHNSAAGQGSERCLSHLLLAGDGCISLAEYSTVFDETKMSCKIFFLRTVRGIEAEIRVLSAEVPPGC